MTRREGIELWGTTGGTTEKRAKSLRKAILEKGETCATVEIIKGMKHWNGRSDLYVEGRIKGKGIWASSYIYTTTDAANILQGRIENAMEFIPNDKKIGELRNKLREIERTLSSYENLAEGILNAIENL